MRTNTATIIATVFIVLVATAAGSAAGRVGVVDLAVVIDESKAGKEANAALNAFIAERQLAADELEARWQQLADDLEAAESSLGDEEPEALRAELDAAAAAYVAAVDEFEAEIDGALQALRDHILSEIGIVLQRVGDARGFDMIVDSSSVFYYRRVVDLTFEVIREYDDLWEEARRLAGQPSASQTPSKDE